MRPRSHCFPTATTLRCPWPSSPCSNVCCGLEIDGPPEGNKKQPEPIASAGSQTRPSTGVGRLLARRGDSRVVVIASGVAGGELVRVGCFHWENDSRSRSLVEAWRRWGRSEFWVRGGGICGGGDGLGLGRLFVRILRLGLLRVRGELVDLKSAAVVETHVGLNALAGGVILLIVALAVIIAVRAGPRPIFWDRIRFNINRRCGL